MHYFQTMGYREIHFNSAATEGVAHMGTRSKRVMELNDPIHIKKFHVRDVDLPLEFNTIMAAQTIEVTLNYTNAWPFIITIPAGNYDAITFATTFQTLLTAAEGIAGTPQVSNVAASVNAVGQFQLVVDAATDVGVPGAYASITVDWPDSMAKYLSRSFNDTIPAAPISITSTTRTLTSLYQMRLVPNYLYLCSNLMNLTPYASNHRALGGYKSANILTKVSIDYGMPWGSIQSWTNPVLDTDFMFNTSHSEINRLEFWFEFENGTVVEFSNNINFSLTLAVIYG